MRPFFQRQVIQRIATSRFGDSSRMATWGAADHFLVSGLNFIITLVLARVLGIEEFGLFTVVYALLLLAGSVQSGLVGEPHNVIGASLSGAAYRDFTASAALLQWLLVMAVSVLALVAGIAGTVADVPQASLAFAAIPALATSQLHDFCRRVMYTEGRTREAASNSALRYGSQVVLSVGWWWAFGLDSATEALALFSVAALLSAARAWWVLRHSFAGRPSRARLMETLRLGKWLGGAAVVGWFSTQVYVLMAMAVVGPGTVGLLRAGETLFRPVGVALTFVESILLVRFGRVAAVQGHHRLRADVRRAAIRIVPALVAALLAIGLAGPALMPLVFGAGYGALTWLPLLYAAYFAVLAPTKIVSSGLRALQRGRFIMIQASVAAVVGTITAVPVISLWGGYGAVGGMIAVSIGSLGLLAFGFLRASAGEGAPAHQGDLSPEVGNLAS